MSGANRDIGIIGGGFTGYGVLLNILDRAITQANNPDHPLYEITIYNPDEQTRAGGIAYGRAGDEHRTNSWVRYMSPFAHKPDDMLEWLEANRGIPNLLRPELRPFDLDKLGPDSPVPRPLYKIYLLDRRNELVARAKDAGVLQALHEKNALVTGLHKESSGGWHTDLSNSDQHPHHDIVALTQGHVEGNKPVFLENLSPECVPLCEPDIWKGLNNIRTMMRNPDIKKIAVIGTGLTANDVIVTADEEGFFERPDTRIYLISRNGYMHAPDDDPNPPMPDIRREDIPTPPKDIADVPDYVAGIYKHYTDQGFAPWTIERKMRPFVPDLIQESGLNPADLARLMKKHMSLVTTTVVGVGMEIYTTVQKHIDSGKVEIVKARINNIIPDEHCLREGMVVNLTQTEDGIQRQLHVSRVLNAAGFSNDYTRSQDPLMRQMVANGIVSTEPYTGLGIAVDEHQHPINQQGDSEQSLYLAGPLTTGCAAMQGRVGPFSVNVDGLRGNINTIAENITGMTPEAIPARQILPSGTKAVGAKQSIIPKTVLRATRKLLQNTETVLREHPQIAPEITTATHRLAELYGESYLTRAIIHNANDRSSHEAQALVNARAWFDTAREIKKMTQPRVP